jgi:glycosyltransferase involved in cell wall biosynthesis
MKVLHLLAWDMRGGATLGAYWLHQALRGLGVDSTILTNGDVAFDDDSVISLAGSGFAKMKLTALRRLGQIPVRAYRRRQPRIFNTGIDGVDFSRHPAYLSADLVHVHWANGMVSTRTLGKVRKPLVWTLRDMWPFTGGCHYSMDCDRYSQGCGRCPQLGSENERDLSRLVAWHKRSSMPPDIRIVGISNWLSDCARKSPVFSACRVSTISNNVDTRLFSPLPKDQARRSLGLDENKKVVLVGAPDVTSFYKGFDLFLAALRSLQADNLHVVMFGKPVENVADKLATESTSLGYLSSAEDLRVAYSAADVFVAPSRMDAFGKTLVESMLCGTPVVCFDATGPKDIVEHLVSGYRAEPFSPQDLAHGIQWVIDQPSEAYAEMCRAAEDRARRNFDSKVIARQYVELYQEALRDK